MALISVSGDSGCRPEELARLTARKLGCELVTESALAEMIARQFDVTAAVADRAWPFIVTSLVSGLLAQNHVVLSAVGGEHLFRRFPDVLRVRVVASTARRVGELMVDRGIDRATARQALKDMIAADNALRTRRFGGRSGRVEFDLTLNAETFTPEQLLHLVASAVEHKQMFEAGTMPAAAEAQVQFQARLQLAKYGLTPPDRAHISKREFGHPSEEIFANLLDFYRIAWQYEPRSFPLQWDKNGKVLEAFTPDFYLPEVDLFVELTTMKQTLVTRKNRKIRLLRAIYPHVNIQIFYQKDLQDLIMKYGIAGKAGA